MLGQPKAASIHASAIVVTPDTRDGRPAECFDFLPVRKMDGALVSEFDGYSVDEIGLLKEDVLATKELAKLSAVIALVNRNFGQELTIGRITQDMLEDGKTYRLLSDGNTQNVFQFSSPGITRFIQDVQPECIEDLIAINALYRPATLDIGATDDYVRFRRGEVAPVYNYGCYEATKNTFGIMVYQEQFMSVAHTLGGFDLGKTDYLRKAIGKKKADLMATLKADFIALLKKEPRRFIAQEVIDFLDLDIMENGKLVPRKADLRAYVLMGKEPVVWKSGLTRFSRNPDSFIVNSSQGGGFKDTWVLSH